VKALSVSLGVLPSFHRPSVHGVAIGEGYVDFGTFVLALTVPGRPRMPNGVETTARAGRGDRVALGDGALRIERDVVEPGPAWNPVPAVSYVPTGGPWLRPDVLNLAGRGPGLTPAGDDVLVGYAAGLALFHGQASAAAAIARRAGPLTTSLSATLLEHASRGELPEPAHLYLESGDAAPLERFGHTSGRCVRLGLTLAAAGTDGPMAGLDQLMELAGAALL
jgi:Protein of unknown function (DUF2877)